MLLIETRRTELRELVRINPETIASKCMAMHMTKVMRMPRTGSMYSAIVEMILKDEFGGNYTAP